MKLSEQEKKALVDEYAEMFGAGPLYREGAAEDEGYRLMREAVKTREPMTEEMYRRYFPEDSEIIVGPNP